MFLFDWTEFTPESYELEDQPYLQEALRIIRRAQIVEATHWTYAELDDQNAYDVEAHRLYLSFKGQFERERMDLDTPKHTGA